MNTIAGFRIVVNPILDDVPRMQLLPKTREIVTPEFAVKMNQWMLDFFGTENRVVMMSGGVVAMGPKSMAVMKTRSNP